MNNYTLIKEYEGLRLSAYLCPANVWTIGYGTTYYPNGKPVLPKDTCTEQQAELYLDHYVQNRIIPILSHIKFWQDLNPYQQDAIISFAYNLGEHFYHAPNFESISKLLDTPSKWRDAEEVRRVFGLYIMGGGRRLEGLVRRRSAEASLFLTPIKPLTSNYEETNDILRMWVYYKNEPQQRKALTDLNTALLKQSDTKQVLIDTLHQYRNTITEIKLDDITEDLTNALPRMAQYFTHQDYQIAAAHHLYTYLTTHYPDLLTNTLQQYRTVITKGTVSLNPLTINWYDPNAKVSNYFAVYEVTQSDIRRIPTDDTIKSNIVKMAQALDKIREAINAPIMITSWYRPPAINKAVGGASKSQHLTGSAVDIYTPAMNIYDFQTWLDNYWDCALGYGAKRGFVHLDLRPSRIRWHY